MLAGYACLPPPCIQYSPHHCLESSTLTRKPQQRRLSDGHALPPSLSRSRPWLLVTPRLVQRHHHAGRQAVHRPRQAPRQVDKHPAAMAPGVQRPVGRRAQHKHTYHTTPVAHHTVALFEVSYQHPTSRITNHHYHTQKGSTLTHTSTHEHLGLDEKRGAREGRRRAMAHSLSSHKATSHKQFILQHATRRPRRG